MGCGILFLCTTLCDQINVIIVTCEYLRDLLVHLRVSLYPPPTMSHNLTHTPSCGALYKRSIFNKHLTRICVRIAVVFRILRTVGERKCVGEDAGFEPCTNDHGAPLRRMKGELSGSIALPYLLTHQKGLRSVQRGSLANHVCFLKPAQI